MKSKKLLATFALSALLLTGCSMNFGNAIIKVNGEKITQNQFDDIFDKAVGNSMFSQMGIDVKKDKNSFIYLMLKDKVVNELIVKKLIDQEMSKRKIKVTKADTEDEMKNIISKIGSKEKFEEILKQNGVTSQQFKKDLEEEVKMKKLVGLLSNINITESDAKKFYKENPSQFKYPDKVRASHILISANPEEIKATITAKNKNISQEDLGNEVNKELQAKKAKAEKLLAEVKKNPNEFAKIAKDNSDDVTSAKQGGDLGYFGRNEMVDAFAKVAFSIKPNTVSSLVQTPYGYHIIMVKDRKAAGTEPYAKVKDSIIAYLTNQEQIKVLENLIDTLKSKAKIEYVNDEYNPEKIQEALKKHAKSDPTVKEELEPASTSATPTPKKGK